MSTSYEQEYGMVRLPQLVIENGRYKDAALILRHDDVDDDHDGHHTSPPVQPARGFAEVYLQPVVRSILTVEQFMRWSRRDHRVEEANLWSLLLELLLDAEQSSKYNPDAIGISDVQPHRRWYISHQAHIQDLLQRHPLLRRMNIIMRWLEQTYREGNTPLKLSASQLPEEALLLRQIILSHLRGGELYRAIDLAVSAKNCTYSCLLSAAQMQTVAESWFNATPLVPLFGEYGNGEMDQVWVGNEHRLDSLSQLYEDSVALSNSGEGQTTIGGLDAVIASVLCGNLDVMEPAFVVAGNWKDAVWCHLRSALVLCFTKTLMSAHHPVDAPYAGLVEKLTGSHDVWQEKTAHFVVQRLATRLQSTYLETVSLEEQLQMRIILQFLSPGSVDWMNLTAEVKKRHCDEPRLISHLLLSLDTAYNEALHAYSVQVYSRGLSTALALYVQDLAQMPNYPTKDAMRSVIAMNLHLRDVRQRAAVYAAFLVACRRRELEFLNRQDVELHEEKLVHMFCKADPDNAVHDEVMRLLNQKMEPGLLLTHNPVAEDVMWRAMHADSHDDFVTSLRHALNACITFWLAEPHAELDAITDVSVVLQRTILPNIQRDNNSNNNDLVCAEADDMELTEAHFWLTFSRLRSIADDHARSTAQLDVAHGKGDKTLVFQLAQEEGALLRELYELTNQALSHGGALVRHSRACITAITWLVQLFVEEVTLSVRLSDPGSGVMLEQLRNVFSLVEQMDALGYVDPDMIPQRSAKDLFDAVRAVRLAYGQKAHDMMVREAINTAAARRLQMVSHIIRGSATGYADKMLQ